MMIPAGSLQSIIILESPPPGWDAQVSSWLMTITVNFNWIVSLLSTIPCLIALFLLIKRKESSLAMRASRILGGTASIIYIGALVVALLLSAYASALMARSPWPSGALRQLPLYAILDDDTFVTFCHTDEVWIEQSAAPYNIRTSINGQNGTWSTSTTPYVTVVPILPTVASLGERDLVNLIPSFPSLALLLVLTIPKRLQTVAPMRSRFPEFR